MTTKVVPDDAVLGRIAKRQHDLFRRVRQGTLDPNQVLSSLQAIIENEVECLDIENVDWKISSKVHEVAVREGEDFVSEVKKRGFLWEYGNYQEEEDLPIYKGSGKRRRKKARFRLAELTSRGNVPIGVIKAYAEMSGYGLADPWELLSFVEQSAATRIIKRGVKIIALGDTGLRIYGPGGDTGLIRWTAGEERLLYFQVNEFLKKENWSFDIRHSGKTLEKLNQDTVGSYCYILLRERD
jgi:hypothetical protein